MIWLLTSLLSIASADALNVPETSYTGATILEGDIDVWFSEATDASYEQSDYTA